MGHSVHATRERPAQWGRERCVSDIHHYSNFNRH